jgi:hypothetical protein
MRLARATFPVVIASALMLAGCGSSGGNDSGNGNADGGPGNGGSTGPATQPADQPAPADSGATLTVTIDGKKYDATSKKSTCSQGATGPGSFGNQYSDDSVTDGYSSLQMIVPDAASAKGGTDNFKLTVTIGKLFEGTDYDLDPKNGGGSGTLTLDYAGDGGAAQVTYSGTTGDGHEISGTLACSSVLKLG